MQWAVHDSEYVWFEFEIGESARNIELLYKSKFSPVIVSYLQELLAGRRSSGDVEVGGLFTDSDSS